MALMWRDMLGGNEWQGCSLDGINMDDWCHNADNGNIQMERLAFCLWRLLMTDKARTLSKL